MLKRGVSRGQACAARQAVGCGQVSCVSAASKGLKIHRLSWPELRHQGATLLGPPRPLLGLLLGPRLRLPQPRLLLLPPHHRLRLLLGPHQVLVQHLLPAGRVGLPLALAQVRQLELSLAEQQLAWPPQQLPALLLLEQPAWPPLLPAPQLRQMLLSEPPPLR